MNKELYEDLTKLIDSDKVPSKDIYNLALVIDKRYNGEPINYPLIIKNSSGLPKLSKYFSHGDFTREIQIYINRLTIYSIDNLIDKMLYVINSRFANRHHILIAQVITILNDVYVKYSQRIIDIDTRKTLRNKIDKAIDAFPYDPEDQVYRPFAIEVITKALRSD